MFSVNIWDWDPGFGAQSHDFLGRLDISFFAIELICALEFGFVCFINQVK